MYKNKHFLLTHIWLRGFGGAEINILELATYLSKNGAKIDVFTFLTNEPLISKFENLNNVKVVDDFEYDFKIEDYDYIISAQNIIPNSIIRGLSKKRKKTPKFMFLHMSSLFDMALEQPFIHDLEAKISSASLPVSDKVVERNLSRFFEKIPNLNIYPNPSPEEYSKISPVKVKKIRKVLSISNHPPDEIKGLEKVFKDQGIEIDFIGVWTNRYELITPEIFSKYDVIIGIGKNAQYCLVAGIPVYVYDHYNGAGYLNRSNYKKARNFHFSGRELEGVSKTTEQIANEIINEYSETFDFQAENRHKFIEDFSIDRIIPRILKSVDDQPEREILFDESYVNYVIAMNVLLKYNVAQKDNDAIEYRKMRDAEIETNKGLIKRISESEHRISMLESEVDNYRNSTIWRIAKLLRKISSKLNWKGKANE